ncbi:MAG: membrane protein insertase YidC [Desulfosalsimonadaceae bacterium]
MEQWRLLLAIVLSIFVFFIWEVFFVEHKEVQSPPVSEQTDRSPDRESAEGGAPKGAETSASSDGDADISGEDAQNVVSDKQFQTVTVKSPLYTARISQRGAAFTSFVLHKYREEAGEDAPFKQLVPEGNRQGTSLVYMAGADPEKWFNARFTTDLSGERLELKNEEKTLSFFWKSPGGIVVEKRYTFLPDSYKIDLDVVVNNTSGRALTDNLVLTLQNPLPADTSRFAFEGPFAYMNGDLEEFDVDDIGEEPTHSGNIEWAGLCDRYFMTTAIPEAGKGTKLSLARNPDRELMAVSFIAPHGRIQPDMQDSFHFSLYMGPKRLSVLRDYDSHLAQAVNFGFFDIIAKPCLWLMNAIHDNIIANYGVAIILLTILFKVIFWPLGSKSYRSMAEMKRLQPLMADIRKKYKDDKKKMNEEVMRLYKTYKVNPMSGCLPMVVQIPVFIAFYRMLYEAIELRHAPFMLWINDLSSPDRLFRFDVNIPLMLPPYGIPVLTIIMGATMFLQQKLSPPPGDPSQAKFMMMLPLIFTFIFINFPSGLVLYWLVNNLISIAQQYYITKKTV